jgi:biofilm PGA synthesis N-glycosyltransferase PgaC
MAELLHSLVQSTAFMLVALFVGLYPTVVCTWWIAGSLVFARHREGMRLESPFYRLNEQPPVSVLLAAHNEEIDLPATLESLFALDWPHLEIVIVDDGSVDGTNALLAAHAEAGRLRLITKVQREGKAMALADALPFLQHELILLLDADARPAPDVLRWAVPHLVRLPRVGAVALNPRVANITGVITSMQAIEFTATISTTRRAQATWGRVMTVSGVGVVARKTLIERVGRWDPTMATEDIALTWQLQRDYWDVRYEPQALVEMRAPESARDLWRQRLRWGRGLVEVFKRDRRIAIDWTRRRMWPVLLEAALSTLWAHLLVVVVALWVVDGALSGFGGLDGAPLPAFWGMVVITTALVQILTGILLDRRHDRGVGRVALIAVWYPLVYWSFNTAIVVRTTLPALLARPSGKAVTWRSPTRS